MKGSRLKGLAVLAVFLVGAGVAWKLHGAKQAEDQEVSQGMTRWEYLVVEVSAISWQTELNKQGSEGWELVSALRALETYGSRLKTLLERGLQPDIKYQCVFKRPRKP